MYSGNYPMFSILNLLFSSYFIVQFQWSALNVIDPEELKSAKFLLLKEE